MDRIVRLASCVLLLVACRESTDPLEQLRSLEANRSLWEKQNLDDYTYTGRVFCGLCPTTQLPVSVTVISDMVSSVKIISTGVEIATSSWMTVNELFDYAEGQLADSYYTVRIQYDQALGYPTQLDVSCPAQDCAGGIEITNLIPIT
jgi:uncharacterized protein DUF6174